MKRFAAMAVLGCVGVACKERLVGRRRRACAAKCGTDSVTYFDDFSVEAL